MGRIVPNGARNGFFPCVFGHSDDTTPTSVVRVKDSFLYVTRNKKDNNRYFTSRNSFAKPCDPLREKTLEGEVATVRINHGRFVGSVYFPQYQISLLFFTD